MTIALCAVVVRLAAGLAAQSKPDFSGHWVLLAPSDAPMDAALELTVRQIDRTTSVQGVLMTSPLTSLMIDRQLRSGSRSEIFQIGVEGGTVGGPVNGSGRRSETRYSVNCDGDKRVIQTGSYSGPMRESESYTEHQERWSVYTQNRLVMTVTDSGSERESSIVELTYRRQ